MYSVLTFVTLYLQDVSFKRPFYQAPVLLLSPSHKWNKGNALSINPDNNAITSWVEVRTTLDTLSLVHLELRVTWETGTKGGRFDMFQN